MIWTLESVAALPAKRLPSLLRAGHAIDARALDQRVYRGVSLGLPRWAEALTWKTFAKTFYRPDPHGALYGWNIRVEQQGLDGPLVAKQRRGKPFCFGYYGVTTTEGYKVPAGLEHGLLIQYRMGPNGWYDPLRFVRDPLVALHPDDPSLLLGWSYVHLGGALWTPSYFVLQDEGPIDYVPPAMEGWGRHQAALE